MRVLINQISWMKNIQSKFWIATQEERIKKIKLQMNKHEMFLQQALVLVCLHLSYL